MPDRVKRNVDDVPYAELDGARPMREVLRDRKRHAASLPAKKREAAFRKRAGMIGVMQSCLCTWPLEKTATDHEHAEWCPSVEILRSMAIAKMLPAR